MENNITIKIIRHCPFCDKTHTIELDKNEYYKGKKKYSQGETIEKAFSFFTKEQQEFISRGLCGLCYGKVFPRY